MAGDRDAYDVLRLAVGFAIVAAYVSSMSATLIIEGYETPVEVHAIMAGLATWLFAAGGKRNSRNGGG